jgi:hypothetical protein
MLCASVWRAVVFQHVFFPVWSHSSQARHKRLLCCFVGGGQKQQNTWYYMEMYRSTLLLSCYLDYMATVPERHLLSLVLVAWEKERWVLDTRNHHCIVRRVFFCTMSMLLIALVGRWLVLIWKCRLLSVVMLVSYCCTRKLLEHARSPTTTLPKKWIRVLASFCVS